MKEKKLNIILINLGGPEKIEDLEKYLFNIFSDPYIIDMPLGMVLRPVLSRLISKTRSKSSGEKYKLIGGKSPLHDITRQQVKNLQNDLEAEGRKIKVHWAMRYIEPYIPDVLDSIPEDEEILVIPLYPQFSITTTESVIQEIKKHKKGDKVKIVRDYYNHPEYIKACANIADSYLAQVKESEVHVLFSAHGVPKKVVKKKGDPYPEQIQKGAELIVEAMQHDNFKWQVCYQSRTGPAEWTKPYSDDVVKSLADGKEKAIVIFPISFVAENLETLYDMDIVLQQITVENGMRYYRVPALNDSPLFTKVLKKLVEEYER